MPLTFGEAYKQVCPNGEPVVPDSQQYRDIMELMKQSGFVHYIDTIAEATIPRQARNVEEYQPYVPTKMAAEQSVYISKNRFLSVDVNRKQFLDILNKKK